MITRRSGILQHITSLPSPFGVGDLGPGAYWFADFLASAGQTLWQVLPLTPTSPACGNSPYTSPSAFAGNTILISPERLVQDGLLEPSDLDWSVTFEEGTAHFETALDFKLQLLKRAHHRFRQCANLQPAFDAFCHCNAHWLEDFALYSALKDHFGQISWVHWPAGIRNRDEETGGEWKERLADRIHLEKFIQYVFFNQWFALKAYCNQKDILIIGDAPIYVSLDSSDVWANPHIFRLDRTGCPTHVAGVPPDYFSPTGQLWGNPLYDWEALREQDYDWWMLRMGHCLALFDMIRLDHFRGFAGYYEIPSCDEDATNGTWVPGPGKDFFDTLHSRFPNPPIIAENLGVITPDVTELMAHFGFPGMNVLQFAFLGDVAANSHAPHNHERNSVTYTGTHDNNTSKGWLREEIDSDQIEMLSRYVGRPVSESSVAGELIRMALMSVSELAVIPMQDLLGLGETARMNTPSVAFGNWEWRLKREQITPELAQNLLESVEVYGRIPTRSVLAEEPQNHVDADSNSG